MDVNFFQYRSLKTRITISTLLIFLLGIWSLAFYASRMLREDMQRLLGEQQLSTASFVADDINRELNERFTVLHHVAASISPTLLNNAASLHVFLNQLLILQGPFNDGVIAYRLDGTAITASPTTSEQISANNINVETVAAALKEGKSTIGMLQPAQNQTKPDLAMTVPVLDSRGKVIGALSGILNLGKPNFLDQITQGHYGKTGDYVIVAPQHRQI